MRARRPVQGLSLLAALAGPLACERAQPSAPAAPVAAPPLDAAPAASAPSAPPPSAAPPRACEPAAARCASDAEAERCSADGAAWERSRCDDGARCVGGGCLALPARDAADLLVLRGEGWLDAWSQSAPLPSARARALFAEGRLGARRELRFRPLCAPDGYVSPTAARSAQDSARLLVLRLVSGARRRVRLSWGVAGTLRLSLGGAAIVSVERPSSKPFPDEASAIVEVPAGVTELAALVEPADGGAAGFWLRARNERSLPLDDLAALPAEEGAACSAGALLALDVTRAPIAMGFSFRVAPRLRGLGPRALPDVSLVAELAGKGKSPARELARLSLSAAELGGDQAALVFSAELAAAGRREVRLVAPGMLDGSRRVPFTYRGALHEQVVRLGDARGAFADEAGRASYDAHVQTLERALVADHGDVSWMKALAAEATELAAAAGRGEDPYRTRAGVVRRAYRSALDGELQPYVVYVPRSYRPDKPLSLVLVAHGLNQPAELALRTVIGEAPDEHMDRGFAARHLPAFPDQRAFLAAPLGYGNGGPRQLGEADLLAVLEDLERAYSIDPSRVSLTGYSLGGTVSFVVPLHYPDRFSAAAPLCGYPNLLSYESVRSVPHEPWEDALLAKRYIVGYAENGLHLPLHIVHGGKDGPGRSAVVADRYRKLGHPVIFDVQDDLDHNVWDYAYEDGRMIEWLKARRRPEAPARVRLVTGEYRYDRAYWLRLVAMQDANLDSPSRELASLDAEWRAGERALTIATRAVAAFAVDRWRAGALDAARAVVDGVSLELPSGEDEVFFERAADGSWSASTKEPPREGRKRPGVAGPLDDALRHRLLVVYGTQSPSDVEANRLVARHFSSYGTWAGARFPVKADTEVDDAELSGRSLVLVGRPETNRVTAAIAGALPVRFEPGAIVLRGERYAGDDLGVSLVYPSPRDPREYVVLHAGTTPQGTLASRHLPELAPDYLVYDQRLTEARGSLLLAGRPVLAGGFFGDDWR
jgi:poly(3-hydroxybutyrate) depolymerase